MTAYLLADSFSLLVQEGGGRMILELGVPDGMADLDQGGVVLQRTKVYMGPTLGWMEAYVRPETNVTAGGTYNVTLGDNVILVNVAATVTIQLPDVPLWLNQFRSRSPIAIFEGSIFIKDIGGNAAAFNITVTPFGTQTIDNLAQSFIIGQNRADLRLYPKPDASGWVNL